MRSEATPTYDADPPLGGGLATGGEMLGDLGDDQVDQGRGKRQSKRLGGRGSRFGVGLHQP